MSKEEAKAKVETKEATEVKEPREKSPAEAKTDSFKVHIQAILKDRLGVKVSKETAWNLFKDIVFGTAQFAVNQEDKHVSLSGVGRFEVIKAGARGAKKEAGAQYTAKYRFYPSATVEKYIEEAFGEKELTEDFAPIGLYAMEENKKDMAALVSANKEWLAKAKAAEEE